MKLFEVVRQANVRNLRKFMKRPETRAGAALLVVILIGWGFKVLAEEVSEQDTAAFDRAVLTALRQGPNNVDLVGPVWVENAAADLTALGSFPVAFVLSLLVMGYLLLSRNWTHAINVFVSIAGGSVLVMLLKDVFMRPRPPIVPEIYNLSSSSFPSGHATTAAVVYLTLGILFARVAGRRRLAVYIIASSFFLTFLVGLTRVALGVHYPTDVFGGWALGAGWALFCWVVITVWESWKMRSGRAKTETHPKEGRDT